jgi:hypothetical protein
MCPSIISLFFACLGYRMELDGKALAYCPAGRKALRVGKSF